MVCKHGSLHKRPVKGYASRQVYDLPTYPDRSNRKHKVEQKPCLIGHTDPKNPRFLLQVFGSVQYGPYIKKTDFPYLSTLSVHFFANEQKNSFQDWFLGSFSISRRTLVNPTKAFASQLQPFVQEAKKRFFQSLACSF
ncbi:hypothetical protein CW304_21325 [Bacillus sp. UFRGS-B20]|nr:hypothetical protein CW304_21325 [Bacillus sp. UFRGS-B20]